MEGFRNGDTTLIDKGLNVFSGLKRNYKLHCIDKDEMGSNYPSFCYNIANYLWEGKQMYEETIAECDDGIKVCRETHHLRMLPLLTVCKAIALLHLGESREAEAMLVQSYHVLCLYGMHGNANTLKALAERKFGLKI
jgi:hypothetical protein